MSVLKIKDQNGNWIQIPTIKGEDGQDYVLTENDKQEIADLVDVPVEDVQVNNTSIVTDGVANIPIASSTETGVIKIGSGDLGIAMSGDTPFLIGASSNHIKSASPARRPIFANMQHESTFYGLAKASGDTTQSQSNNAVGTYTDEAKASIQSMLGIPSEDDVITDVQVNGASVVSDGVANISISEPDPGGMVVKTTLVSGNQYTIDSTYDIIKATLSSGINVIVMAQNIPQPYVGNVQMDGVWYLAFGVSTTYNNYATLVGFLIPETYQNIAVWVDQSVHIPTLDDSDIDANVVWSSNKIIDELSQKIDDVQIDGTSAVTNGVANIPIATNDNLGVVRTNSTYGVYVTNGTLAINNASESDIKSGTNSAKPLTPNREHMSTFYGLAKAAGDTTQSSSSNTVGTYTSEAQIAIKQMLGVKDDYDSLVVEVSGTDPVITGKASYRYNCGELYTLSITPPETGTMDIIFTSGATPTVLTLPSTVKMPTWWAGIETNTTYEMCITDGVYCGVMSWAT